MDQIKSDIKTILNNKDFESYWQSLDLKNSIKKPEPVLLGSLIEIFKEIQELGISVTDKPNKQKVSKLINEDFDSEKVNIDDLCEVLIDEMCSDEVVIFINKEYFKAITNREWSSENTAFFGLMRDGLFYELGLRYPKFKIIFTDELKEGLFNFKINDLLTDTFTGLNNDQCLVNDTIDRLALLNITGTASKNPANGSECSIISSDFADIAEQAGLTTWDGLGYLTLRFSSVLRSYGKCFLNNKLVHEYLDKLATAWPKLVEVLRNRYAPSVITKTLRLLISEEISIRNLRQIIIAILDMDHLTTDPKKYIILDERLPLSYFTDKEVMENPKIIAEYVRSRMKEYISHKYTRGGNTLVVYLLDPAIEDILEVSVRDRVPVSKSDYNRIIKAVSTEVENLPHTAQNPVILTYNTIRSAFKKLINEHFPQIAIVAYNELAPDKNIQPIAKIVME